MSSTERPATVSSLLGSISDVGRDAARGGYSRPVYSTAELDLRSWFRDEAQRRGLEVRTDRNGVLWAWWGPEAEDSLVMQIHLSSVARFLSREQQVTSRQHSLDRLASMRVKQRIHMEQDASSL